MKHREGVHPARWVGIESPGTIVVAAGVGLLDENHGEGRCRNGDVLKERFLVGLLATPNAARDGVRLGITVVSPAAAWLHIFRAHVRRAMVRIHIVAIAE